MKLILAPDSFKGCLPAREVAAVLGAAVRERHPDWEVVELPLADGGEGTLDVLAAALRGEIRTARVSDPLGRPVSARFGLAGGTAIVEVAEACGLQLLRPEERDPLRASYHPETVPGKRVREPASVSHRSGEVQGMYDVRKEVPGAGNQRRSQESA